MLSEEKLRRAIEQEIDRRINEAFKQYEQHRSSGNAVEFKFTMPHDSDAVRSFQSQLKHALH